MFLIDVSFVFSFNYLENKLFFGTPCILRRSSTTIQLRYEQIAKRIQSRLFTITFLLICMQFWHHPRWKMWGIYNTRSLSCFKDIGQWFGKEKTIKRLSSPVAHPDTKSIAQIRNSLESINFTYKACRRT